MLGTSGSLCVPSSGFRVCRSPRFNQDCKWRWRDSVKRVELDRWHLVVEIFCLHDSAQSICYVMDGFRHFENTIGAVADFESALQIQQRIGLQYSSVACASAICGDVSN